MQSKRMSMIEIGANTGIGLIGSSLITYTILHFNLTREQATLLITGACTVWSVLRQYVVRRTFNKLISKEIQDVT